MLPKYLIVIHWYLRLRNTTFKYFAVGNTYHSFCIQCTTIKKAIIKYYESNHLVILIVVQASPA